jgi:uncharacterized protein (DUF169 family)
MLGLRAAPIAVGFLDTVPAGMAAWSGGAVPAGCSFWQQAMSGKSFYTVAADHYNCAVGSYTHGIELPVERAGELGETLQFMDENGYVGMSEVPGIPTMRKAARITAYAPVDQAPFQPTVVLVAAQPAQAMLLYEATLKAGAGNPLANTLGRPGCAVLPLTVNGGAAAMSFGCRGNRLFTGLPSDELYVAIPGEKWAAVEERLGDVLRANEAMEGHYRAREARVAAQR